MASDGPVKWRELLAAFALLWVVGLVALIWLSRALAGLLGG